MSNSPTLLKIGELARLTGRTVRALRLYEERGLLKPATRTDGGFRQYDPESVDRLHYIDRMQTLGYSLSQIADLLHSWEAGKTPRAAMASVEEDYQHRLTKVRQTIADLKALERELEHSLIFLKGCRGCHEEEGPAHACGCCERETEDDAPLLITGLAGC